MVSSHWIAPCSTHYAVKPIYKAKSSPCLIYLEDGDMQSMPESCGIVNTEHSQTQNVKVRC